ncbi:MAG: hypothetical protein EKK29_10745 [Hyphomicrobiales bacterium]|nr:MAG: hypothetical protein EKK29_10745 [Hyphomicrobiales bacterium]
MEIVFLRGGPGGIKRFRKEVSRERGVRYSQLTKTKPASPLIVIVAYCGVTDTVCINFAFIILWGSALRARR